MCEFPPEEWEIRHVDDLDTFRPSFPEPWKLGVAALLVVKPAAGMEGAYRIRIGGHRIAVKLRADTLFNHAALEAYTLKGEFDPATILFQPNSMASGKNSRFCFSTYIYVSKTDVYGGRYTYYMGVVAKYFPFFV